VRPRPALLAAARDRDPRPARERGRQRCAVRLRPERSGGVRPGGGRAAPRGEDARRRPRGCLRVRALRLPGACDGAGGTRHADVKVTAPAGGHDRRAMTRAQLIELARADISADRIERVYGWRVERMLAVVRAALTLAASIAAL